MHRHQRWLRPGGRLVVISFHSLEDRLVKRTMKEAARPGVVRRNIPEHPSDTSPQAQNWSARPIRPSERELSDNPRSRSAVMRIAERARLECKTNPSDTDYRSGAGNLQCAWCRLSPDMRVASLAVALGRIRRTTAMKLLP